MNGGFSVRQVFYLNDIPILGYFLLIELYNNQFLKILYEKFQISVEYVEGEALTKNDQYNIFVTIRKIKAVF